MKNTKNIVIALLGLIVLTFASCTKDESTPAPASKGGLMLHMHTLADTTEVDALGDTIFLSNGRMVVVTSAKMYVSNIQLVKTDGSVNNLGNITILQKQGTEEYELGEVEAANYKGLRFDVGLSNAVNASTPSASDSVLYQPSMWFGAAAQPDGFVFLNFAGSIDTSAAKDGSGFAPFEYKIGTNSNRVSITMPDKNYTVSPGNEMMLHMHINYAYLFNTLNLADPASLSVSNVAANSSATAITIKNNISGLFEFE